MVYVSDSSFSKTGTGTGFLIDVPLGGFGWFMYILTNWHVIKTIDIGRKTLVDFRNSSGEVTQCKLNPDAFFLANEEYDFAMVALSSESSALLRKQKRNFLPLNADATIPTADQKLMCLGYPLGVCTCVLLLCVPQLLFDLILFASLCTHNKILLCYLLDFHFTFKLNHFSCHKFTHN